MGFGLYEQNLKLPGGLPGPAHPPSAGRGPAPGRQAEAALRSTMDKFKGEYLMLVSGIPIMKVPGCPPIAEVMTGTIVHLLAFDRIPQFYGPNPRFMSHNG